jgi:hypothetical protein
LRRAKLNALHTVSSEADEEIIAKKTESITNVSTYATSFKVHNEDVKRVEISPTWVASYIYATGLYSRNSQQSFSQL